MSRTHRIAGAAIVAVAALAARPGLAVQSPAPLRMSTVPGPDLSPASPAGSTSRAMPVADEPESLPADEIPSGEYVCHALTLAAPAERPTIRILPDGRYAYLPDGGEEDDYEVDSETGEIEWDGVLDHDRVRAAVTRVGGVPMIRLWLDRGTAGETLRVCAVEESGTSR